MSMILIPEEQERKALCLKFLTSYGNLLLASGLMYTELYAVLTQLRVVMEGPVRKDAPPPIKIDVLIALQQLEDCVTETVEEWVKEKPLQDANPGGVVFTAAEGTKSIDFADPQSD